MIVCVCLCFGMNYGIAQNSPIALTDVTLCQRSMGINFTSEYPALVNSGKYARLINKYDQKYSINQFQWHTLMIENIALVCFKYADYDHNKI